MCRIWITATCISSLAGLQLCLKHSQEQMLNQCTANSQKQVKSAQSDKSSRYEDKSTTGGDLFQASMLPEQYKSERRACLAHADLAHKLVLVAVHPSQLANVSKGVLQAICQLESINVAQPKLDVGIHNQLRQPQDLPAAPLRVTRKFFRLATMLGCGHPKLNLGCRLWAARGDSYTQLRMQNYACVA